MKHVVVSSAGETQPFSSAIFNVNHTVIWTLEVRRPSVQIVLGVIAMQ